MIKLLSIFFAIISLTIGTPVQIVEVSDNKLLLEDNPVPLDAKIVLVDDINKFRAAHPDLELTELVRSEKQPRNSIRYTLGARVVGDTLVATKSDFASYGTAQNVKLTLTYPTSGTGAVVTHVLVDVQQSSNVGKGYVTGGGIGQRYIQIVIEAQSTTYFGYSAYIYGR
uniref:CSON006441 protein n=1 Tax=Culicoides sonorensis TaxID=179676 RepID=A0A336LBT0_CULSO